jgi:hypothetical protein
VDWTLAGVPGGIPDVEENVIDAVADGLRCDGSTDDAPALQALIDDAPDPAVVRLPAGTCVLGARIDLRSGVVVRGRGASQTTVECRCDAGCFQAAGAPAGDFVPVTAGFDQGTARITVGDVSGYIVGGGAEIRQENYVPAEADWGEYDVGQMLRVTAIEGETIVVEPSLHIRYDPEHCPEARPIRYVERAGIEDLTLRRIDTGGDSGSNVAFRRVASSWIRRIVSDFTLQHHVTVSESLQVEIRDSDFLRTKHRGDGGQGYGVSLARAATSILVENNAFYETRHAMILQIGANGCVFGYNYAERNFSDDGWDKPALSLHGHYAFMNLYEGNVLGWVGVGDYWGPVGPGNTFLRNHLLGTDRHEEFGPNRGIEFEAHVGTQYAVGNMLAQGAIYGDLSDVVLHGNNDGGEIVWDPEFGGSAIPASYYRTEKPEFLGDLPWPPVGGDLPFGEGTIPAWDRRRETH